MNEFKEYDTIMIKISTGEEREFAIMKEFDLEEKHYLVVSLVEDDTIQEGCYIYRATEAEDGMTVERIEDAEELARAEAFYTQE